MVRLFILNHHLHHQQQHQQQHKNSCTGLSSRRAHVSSPQQPGYFAVMHLTKCYGLFFSPTFFFLNTKLVHVSKWEELKWSETHWPSWLERAAVQESRGKHRDRSAESRQVAGFMFPPIRATKVEEKSAEKPSLSCSSWWSLQSRRLPARSRWFLLSAEKARASWQVGQSASVM